MVGECVGLASMGLRGAITILNYLMHNGYAHGLNRISYTNTYSARGGWWTSCMWGEYRGYRYYSLLVVMEYVSL